ncbi:hypothetical protein [Amycolatopsis sp. NPDC021455]|uniref:hypothetical protein n=1 Tax=Amycolatopsis sp. NPDC021455 TaxID=3154901 RepID=UPI0033F0653F
MAGSGIDKRGIRKMQRELEKEFAKRPIRIPVEMQTTDLPSIGMGPTNVTNYHGPVFNGDMTGAQVAWGNKTVTQNQQNASSTVTPGYEALAKLVTDLLQQLPQVGLTESELRDAEEAGNEVLLEITGPEAPEPGRLRRALRGLRGILAPIATGVVKGTAAGAEDWAKAGIEALSNITF